MKNLILLLAVFSCSCVAITPEELEVLIDAQGDAKLSWKAPTERRDNTPLPASEISRYITCAATSTNCTNACSKLDANIDETTELTFTYDDILTDTSTYFCVMTEDTNAKLSGWSNAVGKKLNPPKAPTGL